MAAAGGVAGGGEADVDGNLPRGGVAGGVCGVRTPADCDPGDDHPRFSSPPPPALRPRSFPAAVRASIDQPTAGNACRTTVNMPRRHVSRTVVDEERPSHDPPVGSRSSIDGSAATRSSGGGPDAAGWRRRATAGVQPGGGAIWTMLRHFGHSRIFPTAASERTASRARHVVQVIENIAFPQFRRPAGSALSSTD